MSGRSRASERASRAAATMQSGRAALVFRNRVAQFRPTWNVGERRSISFREFRQIVRRYRPSRLLPELAALAASTQLVDRGDPIFSTAPPWAIALAARESILWGNEYRRDEVTDSDLVDIFNGHNNIYEGDPAPEDENFVLRLMTRLAYEQFPMQESVFEEVARPTRCWSWAWTRLRASRFWPTRTHGTDSSALRSGRWWARRCSCRSRRTRTEAGTTRIG
jgi:hypothetical protein